MMAAKKLVAEGQKYRDAHPRLFGRASPEWIVEEVYIGSDGIEHARLCSSIDPSRRKTLSAAVLEDKRQFTRAEP
jgi:hypothetical protein